MSGGAVVPLRDRSAKRSPLHCLRVCVGTATKAREGCHLRWTKHHPASGRLHTRKRLMLQIPERQELRTKEGAVFAGISSILPLHRLFLHAPDGIDALFIPCILTLLMRASVSMRDESLTESLDTTIIGDESTRSWPGRETGEGSPLSSLLSLQVQCRSRIVSGSERCHAFACVTEFGRSRHPVTRSAVNQERVKRL